MDLKKRVGALRTCGNHPMEGWLRRAERHTMASADVDTATTDVASVILLILLAAGDSVVGRVIAVPVADDGAAISSSDYYYIVPGIPYSKRRTGFFEELSCLSAVLSETMEQVPVCCSYVPGTYVRTYVRT